MTTKAKPAPAKSTWAASKLRGQTFAFTGQIQHKTKVTAWIKKEGGKLLAAVSANLNYLVVGEKRGSAPTATEQKAIKLNGQGANIQVIEEADFWQLVAPSRDDVIAMLRAGKKGLDRFRQMHPKYNWELCRLLPLPDLSGADLRNADLNDLNLTDVKLDGADLSGANLSHCDHIKMSGARLDGARLAKSELDGLVDCSLKKADVSDCHFWYTGSLDRSDFTGAKLDNLWANHCKCVGVVFRDARMRKVQFNQCTLTGSDFSGADLTRAELGDDLNGASFVGATLADAVLTEANLKNADLRKADLRGANLAGADLTDVDLSGAKLEKAVLARAITSQTDLTKANLAGAIMSESTRPVMGEIR